MKKGDFADFRLSDFHIRGHSDKDIFSHNKKLIAFFIHGGKVYYDVDPHGLIELKELSETTSTTFDRIDDDYILMARENKKDQNVVRWEYV